MSKANSGEEKGVIIFVSSIAARDAQRGQIAYGASKGAIDAILLPMARDLGRHKIRVMAIAPGIFESPLALQMDEKNRKHFMAAIPRITPMERIGRPHEFAEMVGTIVENTYLNGTSLRLHGAQNLIHM